MSRFYNSSHFAFNTELQKSKNEDGEGHERNAEVSLLASSSNCVHIIARQQQMLQLQISDRYGTLVLMENFVAPPAQSPLLMRLQSSRSFFKGIVQCKCVALC
ncbi:hypothetical protein M514_05489 [Trichuris suis]|uniref:Uncharacterized protein n=1 Tax=Trichuris suis TaxID=68888 RepID=A0A085NJK9_9BILA|nr:hypothetical protein M513_05489 [Trichuris suis]KFD69655.1 hypothetical protein M514_05489 [Trichuris suis]